jgi:hypothetical protein
LHAESVLIPKVSIRELENPVPTVKQTQKHGVNISSLKAVQNVKSLLQKTTKAYRGSTGTVQIPVAGWSKAWICGRSPAVTAGSNSNRGMDACLL